MMQPATSSDPINGWQALVIIMPGVLAFLTSSVAVYFTYMLRKEVNHRLTELVDASSRSSRAEGIIEGTATTRQAIASQSTVDPLLEKAVLRARELIAEAALKASELIVASHDKNLPKQSGEPDPNHSGIRRS